MRSSEVTRCRPARSAARQIETYALWDFAALVRELGADADGVADTCGIDLRELEKAGAALEYAAYCRLLEEAARATGVEHFGLLLAQGHGLEILGWLGQLLHPGDTLRSALRAALGYFNLVSRGELLHLDTWAEGVALVRTPIQAECAFSAHAQDATIMEIVQICRALLGKHWSPVAVHLTHRPMDSQPYSREFRCPVHWAQPVQAVVLRRADLDSVLPESLEVVGSPQLVEFADAARLWQKSQVDAVRGAIQLQMARGDVGIEAVATLLHQHPRTLRRHLRSEGATFRGILDETRKELAAHFVDRTSIHVADIGELLCYSDATAFTRSFRRWFGSTPTARRARA